MEQNDARGGRARHAAPVRVANAAGRRPGVHVLGWLCLLQIAVVLAGCSNDAVPVPGSAHGPQAPLSAERARPPTLVSLTFDDGNRTQYAVLPELLDHRMRATFYVNTGLVDRGDPSVMTWDELRHLSSAGNDVGGHTRDHLHITQLDAVGQRVQVCGDRDRLLAQGFDPVSFAYPFGEHDAATEALVRSCGYHTARVTGGLDSTHPAEGIPPADPFTVASLTSGSEGGSDRPLQLGALESAVTAAADHGGGWVPVVLHTVCQRSEPDYEACMASDGPVDHGVLSDFLDWLEFRAPPGTVVLPVSQVSGLP